MPENAFGYVPTPALVAPIEFTLKIKDYADLGGYMDHVRTLDSIDARRGHDAGVGATGESLAAGSQAEAAEAKTRNETERAQIRLLPDGRRLHLHDGPIDLIVEAFGEPAESTRLSRRRGAFRDCAR